jgi:hypothetical protein
VLTFNISFTAAENMLVARYAPFEWRALAYGIRFVLALGIGGLTVHLAGDIFDQSGSFSLLYVMFAVAAILASFGALMLPATKATAPAPAKVAV